MTKEWPSSALKLSAVKSGIEKKEHPWHLLSHQQVDIQKRRQTSSLKAAERISLQCREQQLPGERPELRHTSSSPRTQFLTQECQSYENLAEPLADGDYEEALTEFEQAMDEQLDYVKVENEEDLLPPPPLYQFPDKEDLLPPPPLYQFPDKEDLPPPPHPLYQVPDADNDDASTEDYDDIGGEDEDEEDYDDLG
ncbi:unnamed protein product [Pleuronectes platessa]|uniref:Uncharacterized protein n=1 Tax=Pleuronectes platessa TaxID=8262 RepID=A0A9N7Y7H6_PLEPL|nr:unnamed protein product [Pleuronectes platessa]